jgi:hypothetical protein
MLHTQRNKNSCCELAENATISANEFYGLQRVIRRTICSHAGRMHHGNTRPCVTSRGLVDWTIRHIFSETAVAVRAISCFTSPAAPGDPCDSVDGDNGCVVCCDVQHDFTQQILGSSAGAVHLLSLVWLLAIGWWVLIIVVAIMYAIKAGRGEWAEYPVLGRVAREILKIGPGGAV